MPLGEAPGALDFSPLLGSTTISYVKRATLTTGEGDTRDASDLISVFTVCDYSRSEYIEVLDEYVCGPLKNGTMGVARARPGADAGPSVASAAVLGKAT